jgi:aminoglycoside/choline kinase family phosphotransferase
MLKDSDLHTLTSLFGKWAGYTCSEHQTIAANGSNRLYLRLSANGKTCIGAVNDDIRENEAFFYYSRQLHQLGLPVPRLYAVSDDRRYYIQQDLGDTTLYSYLYDKRRKGEGSDKETYDYYQRVLDDLALFQTKARQLDFSYAYPRPSFDRQSMSWDLSYFKYYYLKLAYIPFDEQLLEDDFQCLIDYLLQADCSYFLYRDFQTRNIMLHDGKLYYIDYQGARQGAAQYDAASLLYSAKCELPETLRRQLAEHYTSTFASLVGRGDDKQFQRQFLQHFYGYVLIRILQALGAYGYRGYFERKDSFLQSIPLAINNLRNIVQNYPLPVELPHLSQVLQHIIDLQWEQPQPQTSDKLTVTIGSFSYKKGLPQDKSGNGGGFIFDCRALPNPGRYPEYRTFTGKDAPVIEFLQREPEVDRFLLNAKALVSQSVTRYIERKFTNLSVYFGCTGGQHRSVYCAEQLASYVSKNFDCHVVLLHREQQ